MSILTRAAPSRYDRLPIALRRRPFPAVIFSGVLMNENA